MNISPFPAERYEFQQNLGTNTTNTSQVWQAFDREWQQHVTIKTLQVDLHYDLGSVERFRSRIQRILSLQHPNIVKIYNFYTTRHGQLDRYIVDMIMEYIPGQSLEAYLNATSRAGKFPPQEDVVRLFQNIGDALDYAHRQGVLHGEIRPSNVLLEQQSSSKSAQTVPPLGIPKLSDFSITAFPSATGNPSTPKGETTLPFYTAPEQIKGRPATKLSDIYSLCAILYEICTGRPPFHSQDLQEFRAKLTTGQPEVRALLDPNIPMELLYIALKGLNREPGKRFLDGASLAKAIHDVLLGTSSESVQRAHSGPIASPPASYNVALQTSQNLFSVPPVEDRPQPAVHTSGDLLQGAHDSGRRAALPKLSSTSSSSVPSVRPPSARKRPSALPSVQTSASLEAVPQLDFPLVPQPVDGESQKNLAISSQAVLPAHLPLRESIVHFRGAQQLRKDRLWTLVLPLLAFLLLFGSLGAFALNTLSSGKKENGSAQTHTTAHAPTATAQVLPPISSTGIGVRRVGKDIIGISDGTYAFDTKRGDGDIKSNVADLLQHNSGDLTTAITMLDRALAIDSNDGEAHIYRENLRILTSGSPYITIVVGTLLSADNLGVGQDDLQGAFIAQRDFNANAKLSGGVQARVLIASSGSKKEYTSLVSQQIAQLAQHDKTFVGVMGWPFSSRALNAIAVLGKAHIPMVSPTASSDTLTGISPYFFRVAPSNKLQGIAGAKYAEQSLGAKSVALFVDQADPYSQSLANDFLTQFTTLDKNSVVVTENYTVGKTDPLPALLHDALNHHPDVIYFSGYANDMGTLLSSLPADATTPIMGGDALYELSGYPSSARAGFSHLRFTSFAYPDEWDILHLTDQKPAFFKAYAATFDPNQQHTGNPYRYTRPDNDSMLAYDAMVALLKGCNNALLTGKQTITPEDVRQGLSLITDTSGFQGVSGQITFGPDGDPANKAIVILSVDPQGHIQMEPTIKGRFLK